MKHRIEGSIVEVGALSCEEHPRQTSCVMEGDEWILRIYKNPSAQVSAESIMDARAITQDSQP